MNTIRRINFTPDKKTLRQFGWISFLCFGSLALMAWTERLIFSFGLGQSRVVVMQILLAMAVLCALFSLLFPKANLPLYIGLSVISYPIGVVLSYIIMLVIYFGMITPMALIFRMIGKDPLQREFLPDAQTYWEEPGPAHPRESYFKQF